MIGQRVRHAAYRCAPAACWPRRNNLPPRHEMAVVGNGRGWAVGFIFGSALLRANHISGPRDTSTDRTLRTRARQCNSRSVNLIRTQRSGARFAKTQVADQVATIGSACTAEPVDFTLAPLPQANSGIRTHSMRRMTVVAIATMLTTASAFGQNAGTAGPG